MRRPEAFAAFLRRCDISTGIRGVIVNLGCPLPSARRPMNSTIEMQGRLYILITTHKQDVTLLFGFKVREKRSRQISQASKIGERVTEMFGHEERRDGLKILGSQLDEKAQELVTAQSSLRREQMKVKSLQRSLVWGLVSLAV